jgi:hypothetical protein
VVIVTVGEDQEFPSYYFSIDCRILHDPDTMRLRAHAGSHPQILDSVIGHPRLLEVLGPAKWFADQEEHPHLALQCRRGKHRSVALAYLLKHLLRRDGYKVIVEHWNEQTWGPARNCIQGKCAECELLPVKLGQLKAIWDEIVV